MVFWYCYFTLFIIELMQVSFIFINAATNLFFFGNLSFFCHFLDYQVSFFPLIFFKTLVDYFYKWAIKIGVLYVAFLFYIRSFFLKERKYFIPCLMFFSTPFSIYVFNRFELEKILGHFLFINSFILFFVGFSFIFIDIFCSAVSNSLLHISDSSTFFMKELHSFFFNPPNTMITSHYKAGGVTALLLGKSAMTPTGRAAIMAGVITVGGVLANTVLQNYLETQTQAREHAYQSQTQVREHAHQIETQIREHAYQSQENQKDREWETYRRSWNPFKKPPKS